MKTLHTIYTSFAKRVAIIFILLISIGVTSVWGADELAYTITFSNSANGATQIQTFTQATTVFANTSTTYVTAKPFSNITYSYYGGSTTDEKSTIRVGKSGNAGAITIALSESGKVSATKVVVNCKLYSSTKSATLSVNNQTAQNISSSYSDLTFEINNDLASLSLATSQYAYIKSISVYKAAAPTTHTVTIKSNNVSYGTVDPATIADVANNAVISMDGNRLTVGSTIVTATPAEKDANYSYSFTNWTGIPSGNKVTANCTITANFTRTERALTNYRTSCNQTTYSVTYDANGATSGSSPTDANSPYAKNTSVTVLGNTGNLIKTGHTFNGWNTQEDGKGTAYAAGDEFTITDNTTLYAQWTANTYTISFDMKGGTDGTESIDATYGKIMPDITKPTRIGYTFGGYWTHEDGTGTQYYNQSGGAYSNKKWDQATDATLYAKWTANKYMVKFNGNGNTGGSMSDQSFTYDTPQNLTTNAFTRTGYTFKGWNTNKSGNGTPYTDGQEVNNLSSTSGGQITLYAQWTELSKYTVSFSTGTGNPTQAAIKETTGGAGITLPAGPTPTCTDWTFAGWSTTSVSATTTTPDPLYAAGSSYKPTSNITLCAVYSKTETTQGGGTTSTEASLSFASTAQRTSFSSTQQVWEQNDITLTNNKSASTSSVADYSNPARFYASSEIIIEAPGNITQIVATCPETKYATALVNSVGTGASSNNNVATIIPAAPSTTYTIAKLAAQVQMLSLAVTYTTSGGGSTTTTTYNSNPECGPQKLATPNVELTYDCSSATITWDAVTNAKAYWYQIIKTGDDYIRQNEKCAFYKTKSATKFQKQQTPIAKVCCFF